MSNRHNNIPWRPVRTSSFVCIIFLLFLMLIFGPNFEDYTSWYPFLFVILILGSCITFVIMRRKRAQRAAMAPPPEPQTNMQTQSNQYRSYPPQTSPSSDVQYQPLQTPPQQMKKLCPVCGAQLDDEILKQLIISGRAYCTFCGNQIQK